MTPPDEPPPTAAGDHVHLELVQDQHAPGEARLVARQSLIGWQLPGLVDAVVLAVSELVTNAVRYGRPPLSMDLRRRTAQVALAVHDGNPTEPPDRDDDPADPAGADGDLAAAAAESGRGLHIVAALADDVHIEQVPGDGKIIHAAFDAGPHPS